MVLVMLTHYGAHGKLKLFHLEDGGFNHQRDYKNSKCIYAKNLGLIINNPKQNKIFLQKFHNKNPGEFNKAAEIKIANIKVLMTN